jgi:hypothetical protein
MIPNLQPNTSYAVHLSAASSSGGKDWVGSITDSNEIHTYWGRTGHINQHTAKPGDFMALQKIISQKMNGKDRYIQVDEYHPQQGWQSQRKQTPVPSQPKALKPVAAPIVDWAEAPNASIKWDF